MNFYKHIFFFSSFLFITTSYSQEIPVQQLTVEDGLANSVVYRIYQDKKGYLWFCTDYGLSKYDGYEFVNFFKSNGLPSNFIMSVTEDSSEAKWISCYNGGIACLNKNGRIESNLTGQPLEPISVEYASDRVWILESKNSVKYFEIANHKVANFVFTSDKTEYATCIKAYKNILYISTNKKIYKIVNTKSVVINNNTGASLIDVDDKGNVFGISGNKIFKIEGSEFLEKIIPFKITGAPTSIQAVGKELIWLATAEDSLFFFDFAENKIKKSTFIGVRVNDIYCDKQNSIWIATYGKGVLQVKTTAIKNYTTNNGLSGNIITGITEDESGKIWVTCNKGVNNIVNNKCTPYIYFGEGALIRASAFRLENGDLLYADYSRLRVISSGKETENISLQDRIYCVEQFSDGIVWAGTKNGVYYNEKNNFKNFTPIDETKGKKIYTIFQSSDNKIWLGSDEKIFVKDGTDLSPLSDKTNLPKSPINAFAEDDKANIWIATDAGLCYYDGNTFKISDYTDQLKGKKCVCLAYDAERKELWIGTMNGLYCLRKNKMFLYTQKEGLCGNEIKSLYISKQNKLFVGTINGLSILDVGEFSDFSDFEKTPVYITTAVSGETVWLTDSAVFLPFKSNNLYINFTAINYLEHGLKYEYKLQGLSENWIETNSRGAQFTSLAPGKYLFCVRALSRNENTTSQATFAFSVETPFWMQKWFFVLCVLFFIAAITIVFRWRVALYKQKERQKLEEHKKLITLEHRALSALMNPHFIFNVLNSIQYYMKYVNAEKAHEYLKKFTSLIRINFDNAKNNFNPLSKEISALDHYLTLEKIRFDDKMEFEIKVDSELDQENIMIPSLMIQPYAENAIWHGIMPAEKKGLITVEVKKESDDLFVIITDNGIGINASKKSEKHNSSAISLTKERLDILSRLTGKKASIVIADLKEKDPLKQGTEVIIQLPLLSPDTII